MMIQRALVAMLIAIPTVGCTTVSRDDAGEVAAVLRSVATSPQGEEVDESAPASNPTPRADERRAGWGGSASFLIGGRAVDDDFEPVEDQLILGIEGEFRPGRFPLGIEVGVQTSLGYDQADVVTNQGVAEVDRTAVLSEFYVGPRLTIEAGPVRPYVGGGVTVLNGYLEASTDSFGPNVSIDDNDTTAAGYAHAGVHFDITRAFHVGLDVRGVFGAELDFEGATLDADYVQAAFLVGGHW